MAHSRPSCQQVARALRNPPDCRAARRIKKAPKKAEKAAPAAKSGSPLKGVSSAAMLKELERRGSKKKKAPPPPPPPAAAKPYLPDLFPEDEDQHVRLYTHYQNVGRRISATTKKKK